MPPWFKRFRWPILGGIAGVAAVASYLRQQRAAPVTADLPALPAAPVAIASVPGAEAALLERGAGIGLQGASLGLQTANRGLDLADVATGGSLALAATLAGSQIDAARQIGDLGGKLVDAVIPKLPAVRAPASAPVQTIPRYANERPVARIPAAAPVASRPRTLVRLEVRVAPGQYTLFRDNGQAVVPSKRTELYTGVSAAPVKAVNIRGGWYYQTLTGPHAGHLWWMGPSGPGANIWRVWSDGTAEIGGLP